MRVWNLDGKHLFWQLAILLVAPKYPDQTIFVGGVIGGILEQMKNSLLGVPWTMSPEERLRKSKVQMRGIRAYSKSSSVSRIISQLSTLRKKKQRYGAKVADNPQTTCAWLWNKHAHVHVHTHTHTHFCSTLFKSFSLPGNAWYCHLPDKVHSFFINQIQCHSVKFPCLPQGDNQSINLSPSLFLSCAFPALGAYMYCVYMAYVWLNCNYSGMCCSSSPVLGDT